MAPTSSSPPTPSRWLRLAPRIVAGVFWAGVCGTYLYCAQTNNLSALDIAQQLLGALSTGFWGPLLYIGVYVLRPLILFPSTVLTVLGGFVFGPVAGVLYTIVASNLSSSLAYLVGRFFGQGLLPEGGGDGWIARYATRMRANSFETVLIMRFIFLPYDLVTYLAGLLRIRFVPFILATALGSIPGTCAFVGFGASIERFDGSLPALDPVTLAVSAVIFGVSLVLARLFRKREGLTA